MMGWGSIILRMRTSRSSDPNFLGLRLAVMIQPGLKDAILNKRMGIREVKTHPLLGLVSFQ